MNRIFPENKEITPLPNYGVGAFLIVDCIEFDTLKNWLTLKGKLYEINQDTGEFKSKGEHRVDCPFNVQSVCEIEEAKDELEN